MSLSVKQRKFMRLLTKLLVWVHKQDGYEVTQGDGYRDHRVFGRPGVKKGYGRSMSNHKIRLACDLNLFINGVYQTTTKAHRPLGVYWESLDSECAWGGHFSDGNHYSLKHNGRR